MPAWVWKFAPWGIALAAALTAVKMYGDRRAAEGQMTAHIETADRLQQQLTADSTANAAKAKVQADSIASLNKTVARATAQQAAAKATGDSLVQALAATLDATQRVQLAGITAAVERERAAWSVKEMAYTARLRLKDDSLQTLATENDQLRAINASLRAATEAASGVHGGPSFVQRVAPYVAAALLVTRGIELAAHKQ